MNATITKLIGPWSYAIGAFVLLASTACADLRALAALQSGVSREFKEPEVAVNLNGRVHLTVYLYNSSRASLAPSDQATFAREVADFVRAHYQGYGQLQTVHINLATRTRAGPVTTTRSGFPYVYSTRFLDSVNARSLK